MTQVTITLQTDNPGDAAQAKVALQKLADNAELTNLKFLASLAAKPGINKKIADPLVRAAIEMKL